MCHLKKQKQSWKLVKFCNVKTTAFGVQIYIL